MKKIGAQVTKKQNMFDQIMIALKNNITIKIRIIVKTIDQ